MEGDSGVGGRIDRQRLVRSVVLKIGVVDIYSVRPCETVRRLKTGSTDLIQMVSVGVKLTDGVGVGVLVTGVKSVGERTCSRN